ncbi:MAG: HEAT repeat domain-containing protein [Promethearchaeati archaeon]
MDNNIKDLIDEVEKENATRAQMEHENKYLKEEIKRLKFTIKEQSMIIEDQEKKIRKQNIIPDDIEILKEIIQKQRENLEKKSRNIDNLKFNIDNLINELQELRRESSDKVSKDDLISANSRIEELKDINSKQSIEISKLKSEIAILEERPQQDLIKDQLTKAETRIKQLESRNEDLIAQINYFQDELDKSTLTIKSINQTRNQLLDEIQSYKEKIKDLNSEIESMKSEVKTRELKNKELGEMKENLNERIEKLIDVSKDFKYKSNYNLSYHPLDRYSPIQLIERSLNLMNEENKQKIINSLISDLSHSNLEIRTLAVIILGIVRSDAAFNALIKLKNDDNWIVRYYLVKTLSRYGQREGLREIMVEFLKDKDIDVRELAFSYFNKF